MSRWAPIRLRSWFITTSAVLAVTLLAVPAAYGFEPEIIPAGQGCSFDVEFQQENSPQGEHPPIGQGEARLTNLDTGVSIYNRSRYTFIETFDPATNDVFEEYRGRRIFQFLPGDQGPFGEVGEHGALLRIVGNVQATFDLDTELYTAFSVGGEVTDLCPLLDP